MKVWATSDLHIDYQENLDWFLNLSSVDYTEDILILAGDIIPDFEKIRMLFQSLVPKFKQVLFVPGNHDLWFKKGQEGDSIEKFHQLLDLAEEEGVSCKPFSNDKLAIVPLFSWYDYTFGKPSIAIQRAWVDFKACRWSISEEEITNYFLKLNEAHLNQGDREIISFSHFVPCASVIPDRVPKLVKALLPVFGSSKIEEQIHQLNSTLHIYGHSHLNRSLLHNGVWYLNNAFGYPHEAHICRKYLMRVYENDAVVTGIKQWPRER